MSKYPGVPVAVKWTEGYFKAVNKHHREWLSLRLTQGRGVGRYFELMGEVNTIVDNWTAIARRLEAKLESDLDSKVVDAHPKNKLNNEPKKKSGTLQRIRNFRKHNNDSNAIVKSIDNTAVILKDVATEVLLEFGLPTRPLNYLSDASIVTPDYFAGVSGLGSSIYENRDYHLGQHGTNRMDGKTYQKLTGQSEKRKIETKQVSPLR